MQPSTIVALLVGVAPVALAVPPHFDVQGRLSGLVGEGVDATVALTVTVLEDAESILPLHKETFPAVPVIGGVFSVRLGTEAPLDLELMAETDAAWVQVAVDGVPVGGPIPMSSVAYSARAAVAERAKSVEVFSGPPEACSAGNIGRAYLDLTDGRLHYCAPSGWQVYEGPTGPKGDPGVTGDAGSVGPVGAKGDIGSVGPVGAKGDIGSVGPTGAKGDTGSVGPTGAKGDTGSVGPTGAKGDAGSVGPTGAKGDAGSVGPAGAKGDTGSVGPAGAKGDTGFQGLKGDAGAKGDVGLQGPKGDAGAKGDTGSQGQKGDTGAAGPQGSKGDTGAVGSQGLKGDTGLQGPAGDPRATYTIWNSTTCGSGDPQLYTGNMATSIGEGGGVSSPFCLQDTTTSTGWISWEGAMVWRALSNGATNVRGQYANGAAQVRCAVCQGTAFVRWGSVTCPTTYTSLYAGYIGGMAGAWGGGWHAGGPICMTTAAAGATWVNWTSMMIVRAIGSSASNRVQYMDNATMTCVVCY